MDTSLAPVFDVYVFPTGRRLFALGQVVGRLAKYDFPELFQHCAAAVEHDRTCLSLERRWGAYSAAARRQPKPQQKVQPEAARTDALVDRTLTAIRDHASAQAEGAPPGDPIHTTVAAFLKTLFPTGVHDVTSLPYIEELAAVDDIVTKLQGELAPVVQELGAGRLADRLGKLAVDYRAVLEAPAPETVAFGDVRAARAEGQERLLQTIALIVGRYYKSTPEHVAARAELLGPIFEQNEAIARAMRARRMVEDVNPESGEPEPGGAAAEPADGAAGEGKGGE